MSLDQQQKSRRSMVLLVAIFLVPVILAKLALTFHWFDYGVTNKGTLVEGELNLEKLGLSAPKTEKSWLLIYAQLQECDQYCQQVLASVTNTYTALGKEMPRVQPLLLSSLPLNQRLQAQLKKWSWQQLPDQVSSYINSSQVLIVDPLGNVVLSHTPPQEAKQLPFFGKEILVDLKKLLKYSRIG